MTPTITFRGHSIEVTEHEFEVLSTTRVHIAAADPMPTAEGARALAALIVAAAERLGASS